jgi:hypothetical protein
LALPNKEEFPSKKEFYENFYEEYQVNTLLGSYFQFLSLSRFIIFGLFLVIFEGYPIITISFTLIISLTLLFISIIVHPFNTKSFMWQISFLEILNLLIFSSLMVL